jgi:ABC-type nickel/cobalt efflux system permease component RcnA
MRQRQTKLFVAIFGLVGVVLLSISGLSFYFASPKRGWLQAIGAIMVFAIALWFWADIRRRD